MVLQTTVVGSFPKPDYLAIPDWFQVGSGSSSSKATTGYSELLAGKTVEELDKLEANIVRAIKEVVQVQTACGIDVVTDGEVRRENYIHYLCRFIEGIIFQNLTATTCRNGAYKTDLPTIRGKVSWRGPLDVAQEWRDAQDMCPVPLRYTLPGPMTMIGTLNNAHYESEEVLAEDLAAIVNHHVRALAKAGCKHIQVDEPLFARRPKQALEWGIRWLDRCFEGVDGSKCERTVHICCGYPEHLDQEGYLKADPSSYFQLASALDACCVDAVSIEDAHCKNDLKLLGLFRKKKVILGSIEIASSRVETQREIEDRLRDALQYIDADRLVVAPDCGLGLLPPKVLRQKLTNMCAAARNCGCKRARIATAADQGA